MKDKILDGLKYESLVLNQNVHKLVGTVTKFQGTTSEVRVDDGAQWLVTGLGYLNKETPSQLIPNSLDDIIIVSKSELIEFMTSRVTKE